PDSAFATVLRMLQIMHTKGLLIRDESERAHVYAAAHAQEALQTNMVKDLIQKAFSGSAKNLVMAALRGHISQAEKDEIQQFLDQDKQ
ncbi:BlaI/MecI/CopY family transcriptional regulator, partial [Undibacterium sp.]|uniref:BlaI/MecI/CopY family transcriptional regulator n=1 Tax=Undibacterium sp. TaxID=1914977 RepID=UPI00374DB51F